MPYRRPLAIVALLAACPSDEQPIEGDSSTGGSADTSTATTGPTSTEPTSTSAASSESSEATADSSVGDDASSSGTTTADSSSSTAAPNTAPVAGDDELFTRQDVPLSVDAAGVLANDVDADGDRLTVMAADPLSAGGGAVAIGPDGSFEYTPAAGFFGRDTVGYTVTDGTDQADAVVTVFVAPTLASLGTVVTGVGGFAIDGQSDSDFAGSAVAGAGDFDGDGRGDLLVGAFGRDVVASDAGRSYLVYGDAAPGGVALDDVAPGPDGFAFDGVGTDERFGLALASAGDIDGDGRTDIVLGSPEFQGDGQAYVIFGRDDDVDFIDIDDIRDGIGGFAIAPAFSGDLAGRSVGGAGDVNGDGIDDLVIGAPGATTFTPDQEVSAGRCFVVFGGGANPGILDLDDIAAGIGGFVIDGEATADSSGSAVDGAGDVNGDGLADLIVGAFGSDRGGTNAGAAYVVFGKSNDTNAVSLVDVAGGDGGFVMVGEAATDVAGVAVAGAGDVDGDGLADLIVGAQGSNNGGVDAGRSYVVLGKEDTAPVLLSAIAAGTGGFAIDAEAAGDQSGTSVDGAGDVNGDGLADVIVGSPFADFAGAFAGRAYVVYGIAGVTDVVALTDVAQGIGGFALDGELAGDLAGIDVAGAGDVDGDGFADLVVGASSADLTGLDIGRAYVVFGVPTAPAR